MLTRRQVIQTCCVAGIASVAPVRDSRAAERRTLNVMSFNIWVGGVRGGLEQTAAVILAGAADLVGIQENAQSGEKLADLTGLTLYEQPSGSRGAILSRYPIVAESANKWGVQVQTPHLGNIWMFNAHLPAAPYQPYQLAAIPYGDGNPFISTATEAIAEAIRARSAPVASLLMDMGAAVQADEPILLTGDFNEPSHLDWTKRAAESGCCQLPVAWPTSRAICDAGFSDLYRTVHGDEVARPGHTWTPLVSEQEVHDRIDFIYSRKLKPLSATIIGESPEQADLVVAPYPSDHRAVLATVTFEE